MCGIFGGVGKNVSPEVIRGLAYANLSRGKDSTGFFDGRGRIIKGAKAAPLFLSTAEVRDYLTEAAKSGMIGGHTRQASRGSVTDENSHPFQYGNVIGTHNGHVTAPNEYAVDSMYLFDQLNKEKGDVNKALGEVLGYFALAWTEDGKLIKLLTHDHYVHYGRIGDTWYWSSEGPPLLAMGCEDVTELKDGGYCTINTDGILTKLPDFVGKKREPIVYQSNQNGQYAQNKWCTVPMKENTFFVLRFVPLSKSKEVICGS